MSDDRRNGLPFTRWGTAGIAFAFWTANALLLFAYKYMDVLVRGHTEPVHEKLIEELTGSWGAGLLAPGIFWVARRLRRRPLLWALHLPAIALYSLAHTSWNWGTRVGTFRVLGYGAYDYGIMRLRYLMELPSDVIGYAMLVAFVLLFDHYHEARTHEVRVAELEAEVSRVRLEALEAQLHPHFLFNALNTVSSVMYDDVDQADRILTRLSDLLRRSLRTGVGSEVSLGDELETLEMYLDIVRVRFGDRLSVTVAVDPALSVAAVPHLMLQPLVENAVKHGDPGPGRPARIAISATRENGTLTLQVSDNGPGLAANPEPAPPTGLGLATTRRRLERLYGGDRLRLASPPGGGLTVAIVIPYRTWTPSGA